MDALAFSKLESALTSAKVPRSMWPRYFEKEELRQLRKRVSDKNEYLRILRMKLDQDAAERKRRREFNDLLVLLLWLLAMDHKGSPASFLQFGHRVLIRSEAPRWDWEPAERALCGITICKFGWQETADALKKGIANRDGDSVFPMLHAQRALERFAEEDRQRLTMPAPKPAPALELQPEQHEPVQQAESLDEERQKLAEPNF